MRIKAGSIIRGKFNMNEKVGFRAEIYMYLLFIYLKLIAVAVLGGWKDRNDSLRSGLLQP